MVDILPKPARSRRERAPTNSDPVDIAMEAEAEGREPTGQASLLLADQRRLIHWQIRSERAGFALKVAVGFLGLTVLLLVAGAMWSASRANGLVVEPFTTPPRMVEQGYTGGTVASEVLNQLTRLSKEARVYTVVQVSDSWSGDSHVEIPQTGVSLDEVNRLLRRWLGSQTYVSGAVVMVGDDAVEMTARTGGGELFRARGPVLDLPNIAASVAEQVLARVRPVQYGQILAQRQQFDAAIAVERAVLRGSPSRDEARDAHGAIGTIALLQGNRQQAADEYRQMIDLGGEDGYLNLANAERGLGHPVAAWNAARRATRAKPAMAGVRQESFSRTALALVATLEGDFFNAERLTRDVAGRAVTGVQSASPNLGIENHIATLIPLHQPGQAAREIVLLESSGISPARAASFKTNFATRVAVEREDWAAVLAALDAGPPLPSGAHLETPTPAAWRALALAHLGRMDEARALAGSLPSDCYRCWINRAEIAELDGQRKAADAAFAEAVRQAPRSPFAQTAWARVLVSRGDALTAVEKATEAARASRHFADPVEIWGEALLAQGEVKGAATKFETAAALAPRWGRLHLKWGQALSKLGKGPEAQAQFRAAAGMDLTAAERAELALAQGAR